MDPFQAPNGRSPETSGWNKAGAGCAIGRIYQGKPSLLRLLSEAKHQRLTLHRFSMVGAPDVIRATDSRNWDHHNSIGLLPLVHIQIYVKMTDE